MHMINAARQPPSWSAVDHGFNLHGFRNVFEALVTQYFMTERVLKRTLLAQRLTELLPKKPLDAGGMIGLKLVSYT